MKENIFNGDRLAVKCMEGILLNQESIVARIQGF